LSLSKIGKSSIVKSSIYKSSIIKAYRDACVNPQNAR